MRRVRTIKAAPASAISDAAAVDLGSPSTTVLRISVKNRAAPLVNTEHSPDPGLGKQENGRRPLQAPRWRSPDLLVAGDDHALGMARDISFADSVQ